MLEACCVNRGRAQRQVVNLPERERADDGVAGVSAAADATRAGAACASGIDGAGLDPEGEASTADEC